jgi:broad specificity phosphatase PhoE
MAHAVSAKRAPLHGEMNVSCAYTVGVGAAATLILIRHASIDCSKRGVALLCGSHDAPLSQAGREQVHLLRKRLDGHQKVRAAYSSPLRRAIQTAEAAPARLVAGVRLLRSLAEIHCGEFEGQSIDEIRAKFPELWARNEAQNDENFFWPGGETYRAFRRRVLRAMRAIAARHPDESVLIFTHAGVVNQVLGSIVGQSAALWANYRPHNTGLTIVEWSGDQGRAICFDDRDHLRSAA